MMNMKGIYNSHKGMTHDASVNCALVTGADTEIIQTSKSCYITTDYQLIHNLTL